MVDLPDPKIKCHLTGFTKGCRKLVASGACTRWTHVLGVDANTGQEVNRSDCADNWIVPLMIENSKLQNQTGAAVESFRNEVVRANAMTLALGVNGATANLIEMKPNKERLND
jgi:hypothetical protein